MDPDDVFDMLLGAVLIRTVVYPVTARHRPIERTVEMILRLLRPPAALAAGDPDPPGPGVADAVRGLARGQLGVGARGDDAQDAPGRRQIGGREVEQPGAEVVDRVADVAVPGLAGFGQRH